MCPSSGAPSPDVSLLPAARMKTQRLPPWPLQMLGLLLSASSLQGTICHCCKEAGEAQLQGDPFPATQRSPSQIYLLWPQLQTAGDHFSRRHLRTRPLGPWLRRAKDRHTPPICNDVDPTKTDYRKSAHALKQGMVRQVAAQRGGSSSHPTPSPTYKIRLNQFFSAAPLSWE